MGSRHRSDFDTVLPQHVQCRPAEMAGADQGEPHGSSTRFERDILSVDNMPQESVTPPVYRAAGYQQEAGPRTSARLRLTLPESGPRQISREYELTRIVRL